MDDFSSRLSPFFRFISSLQNPDSPTAPNGSQKSLISSLPRFEIAAAAALLLAMLVLRVVYAFVMKVNSDEPQHLHVVWGWANGMIQYRDLFDNHSPLFQMLCGPFFRLFGERADILIPMRLAMTPLAAVSLWCVFKIGSALYSPRAGLWAAVLTGLYPLFFFTSNEFRTDDLWILCWLLSLSILANGRLGATRGFFIGLILGAGFATSMKTSLLLASLVIATIIVAAFQWFVGQKFSGKKIAAAVSAGLAGMLIVPGVLILFFWSHGALRQMAYCVIEHNTLPSGGGWHKMGLHALRFPIAFPLIVFLGYAIFRSHPDRAIGSRRALVFMTACLFVAALRSFWPLITDQDYMPFVPLAIITASPAVLWIGNQIQTKQFALGCAVPALVAVAEIAALLVQRSPFDNYAGATIGHLAALLKLTDPGDYVMDPKGESIFRKRPFYYVLEGITSKRMRLGLIEDTIPERMIQTNTCVIKPTRLRERTKQFVQDNYLPIRHKMWVAGKILDKPGADGKTTFKIEVPARYSIISHNGDVAGTLDGKPITIPQFLNPGVHEFRRTSGRGQAAVFWAQAVERGFTPFDEKEPDEE